jgi:NO-binding membrane sensor protein with MHYT domain
MIQARTSKKTSHVLTWIFLVSLVFGFCSSWSLHFVGMLSCKMDVAIGLNVGLTIFTGALAVGFTFISLGAKLLRASYSRGLQRNPAVKFTSRASKPTFIEESAAAPLLGGSLNGNGANGQRDSVSSGQPPALHHRDVLSQSFTDPMFLDDTGALAVLGEGEEEAIIDQSQPRSASGSKKGSSARQHWSFGSSRVDDLMSMAAQGKKQDQNAFVATFYGLRGGFSVEAVLMGLLWSSSLTCMHCGGLFAMQIPEGYMSLRPVPVIISAIISWVVCIAGYIYMTNLEPFFSQQILFSVVAGQLIFSLVFRATASALELPWVRDKILGFLYRF